MALAVDPRGGQRLVTGDLQGKLAWWDVSTLRKIKEKVAAHTPAVFVVRYRPDGGQCASAGPDGLVRLWSRRGAPRGNLAAPQLTQGKRPVPIFDLAYSPDGRQLAAGADDGCAYVWDTASRRLVHRFPAFEPGTSAKDRAATRLAYVSGRCLFSGSWDGSLRQWDTRTGHQTKHPGWSHRTTVAGNREVRALAVRPGGRELATAGADRAIAIWDIRLGKLVARLEGAAPPMTEKWFYPPQVSAFCADHHLLITADQLPSDAFLRSWDTRTLRERRTYADLPQRKTFHNFHRVSALAIHPDGSRFVSPEPDGTLVWWDTQSGKRRFTTGPAPPPYHPPTGGTAAAPRRPASNGLRPERGLILAGGHRPYLQSPRPIPRLGGG
jgi:WD40 repeat protein